MVVIKTLVLLMSAMLVSSQRPSFAGTRPIGYPELVNRTTTPSGLVDKFGEETTQRLPIEANGDRDLVDRLSKLPIDKQPFWFINWQAYEANREKPQTYPLKPNPFVETNLQNSNTAAVNGNTAFANANPNSATAGVNQTPSSGGFPKTGDAEAKNRFDSENKGVTTDTTNTHTDGSADKKIETANTETVNDQPKKPESQVDHVLGDPLNKGNIATSNPDQKYSDKKVTQFENDDQFEDIEIKKYVKFLKV
ncbi:uncharacterized protein [Epargyreus clarus]|uniref:uncharacterized protein n=1 Tax=Epargyreus clarus TaxID=520877 RepID=UPI003C2F9462